VIRPAINYHSILHANDCVLAWLWGGGAKKLGVSLRPVTSWSLRTMRVRRERANGEPHLERHRRLTGGVA
jgi:hypothetical protein